MTVFVHTVGQFLPWHRLFLAINERALREECGYKGTIPYWDWTRDTADVDTLHRSPIFDPSDGFGSATSTGQPVEDGPFASYNLTYGPGPVIHNHRLTRILNTTFMQYLTDAQVARTMEKPTFEQFRIELEGEPVTPTPKIHDSGHRLIGGDMANTFSSPGGNAYSITFLTLGDNDIEV
ncbi:hypothetical protein H0H92_007729 [Tricholoma furcatifolium]|nr:hypothetical protein H0H92_007729 [Tricholoma furcatifolium]